MTRENLTLLSSTFIVLSGLSLLLGWYFVRVQRNVRLHRNTMLTATGFAALFLVAYVSRTLLFGSKPFEHEGVWRLVYFGTLVPHIILAIAVGPLALYLLYLALRKRDYFTHRRWARITLPIWLYVAASGWFIYYLLYHL